MKKLILMSLAVIIAVVNSASAIFDEDPSAISNKVTGLEVGNTGDTFMLYWDPSNNGQEASKYRIDYAKESLLGLDAEYPFSIETDDNLATKTIKTEVPRDCQRFDEETMEENDCYKNAPAIDPSIKYYFVVTAIYADGSESDPSDEVSGMASEEKANLEDGPVVVSAQSLSSDTVEVVFSTDIVLPSSGAENQFSIINANEEKLTVLSAALSSADTKVVILGTDPQVEGTSYTVTATAQIVDKMDNPIKSGSTDSASFTFGVTSHAAAPDDPGHLIAEVTDEPEENDPNAVDPNLESLEIENQPENSTTTITEEKDSTPPEDVTNLVATYKEQISDFLVTLKWTASKNSNKDLADQILYRSEDKGTNWQKAKSLGKDATSTTMVEKPETEITYKITTKDEDGNESAGLIRSVKLPATGGGILFTFGAAMFASSFMERRKEKKLAQKK